MFRRHFGRRWHGWRHEEEEREERGPRGHHHRGERFFGKGHRHGPFWFAPPGRGWGGPFEGRPFDEGGGGRRRQRRGDIKYALLELIAEQPRHGYELIKELEQRYGGFYRPSPGTVYPTLQLLEDEGHVTSEQVEGKRVYTITPAGKQLLEERRGREREERDFDIRWPAPAPELHALRESAMGIFTSLMQVARHGSPEQIKATLDLLERTRREVYSILASEDAPKE